MLACVSACKTTLMMTQHVDFLICNIALMPSPMLEKIQPSYSFVYIVRSLLFYFLKMFSMRSLSIQAKPKRTFSTDSVEACFAII